MIPLNRPTATRAVHLRITPRPANLGESREIMRLLSRFGEIEYYKSLKYEALSAPNAALVIFRKETAAQACLQRSPIRFRMGQVATTRQAQAEELDGEDAQSTPRIGIYSTSWPTRRPEEAQSRLPSPQSRFMSTSALPTPPPKPIRMPFDPPPPADPPVPEGGEGRIFQIITNTSTRQFRDQINVGHYHGSFILDTKMPGQEDLVKRVPLAGLSCVDWTAGDRLWRIARTERKRNASRGSLGSMSKHGRKTGGAGMTSDSAEDANGVEIAELLEARRPTSDGSFTPFGVEGTRGKGGWAEPGEDDTLDTIMKGLDSMWPGGSSGSSPKERYSGKPK